MYSRQLNEVNKKLKQGQESEHIQVNDIKTKKNSFSEKEEEIQMATEQEIA